MLRHWEILGSRFMDFYYARLRLRRLTCVCPGKREGTRFAAMDRSYFWNAILCLRRKVQKSDFWLTVKNPHLLVIFSYLYLVTLFYPISWRNYNWRPCCSCGLASEKKFVSSIADLRYSWHIWTLAYSGNVERALCLAVSYGEWCQLTQWRYDVLRL